MKESELIPGEKVITDNGLVYVTNKRVRLIDKKWGKSHVISIMNKNISSIEIHFVSKPAFLVISIIAFLAGLYFNVNHSDNELSAYLLGAISLIVYIGSLKHVVSISSNGGSKITFEAKKMNHTSMEFINKIEFQIIQ